MLVSQLRCQPAQSGELVSSTIPTKAVQQYWVNVGDPGSQGVGLGVGLGDGDGLGAGVGLEDGLGLGQGVGLGVGEGLGCRLGLGKGVGLGEALGSGIGLGSSVGVTVGVGSAEGAGVGVIDAAGVGAIVGIGVMGSPGPGSVKPVLPPPQPAKPQLASRSKARARASCDAIPNTFRSIKTGALIKEDRQIKCRRKCAKTL